MEPHNFSLSPRSAHKTIETCQQCGGRLRVIASIEETAVIERILEHLGHTAEPVDPAHPSRAPPKGDCLV
jgi:hypothetical protein